MLDLKEQLKKVTIFAGLNEKDFETFLAECPVIHKSKNDVIVHEGEEADEIFIILSGRVKIILDIDEKPLELLEIGEGQIIGEASVIGIQKHSASAIASTDVNLFVLSRKTLMGIYEKNKETFSLLILNIARELARRLSNSDRTILQYQNISKK